MSALYVEQTASLTACQMNLIRAICKGYHDDFGKREVTTRFELGSRSNLAKLKQALIDREIVEQTDNGLFLSDPLFGIWFKNRMMNHSFGQRNKKQNTMRQNENSVSPNHYTFAPRLKTPILLINFLNQNT